MSILVCKNYFFADDMISELTTPKCPNFRSVKTTQEEENLKLSFF